MQTLNFMYQDFFSYLHQQDRKKGGGGIKDIINKNIAIDRKYTTIEPLALTNSGNCIKNLESNTFAK